MVDNDPEGFPSRKKALMSTHITLSWVNRKFVTYAWRNGLIHGKSVVRFPVALHLMELYAQSSSSFLGFARKAKKENERTLTPFPPSSSNFSNKAAYANFESTQNQKKKA